MKQDSNKKEFDVNLDPEQTERLKEIFGFNKKPQFGDIMSNKNKSKFYSKIKKILGK